MTRQKCLWGLVLSALIASTLHAHVVADVTVAPLVPIIETDWMALLQGRVAEAARLGLFAQHQEDVRRAMMNVMHHPVRSERFAWLVRSKTTHSYDVELICTQQFSEMSPTAQTAVRSLERTYLMLNADDATQVYWASNALKHIKKRAKEKANVPPVRVVVTGGDVMQLQKELGVRVFADQAGVFVSRFALPALPARIDVQGATAHVTVIHVTEDDK